MRRLHPRFGRRAHSRSAHALRGAVRVGAILAPLAWAASAHAQPLDTAPPLPNVLLLLDTSGSMEKMIDGTDPELAANNPMPGLTYGAACNPTQSAPNRWGIAVQALTGDFNTYTCVDMPRKVGTPFDTEFTIGAKHPYDLGYYLDYHRPAQPIDATHSCVMGHDGSALTGWPAKAVPFPAQVNSDFSAAAIQGYSMDLTTKSYSITNKCTFNQQPNGALDAAAQIIRFGLMTFDSDPSIPVGTTGTGVNVVTSSPLTFNNLADPFTGTWSYYDGWDSNSSTKAAHGRPGGCATDPFFEVGARNPAAPPWEGRMIRFPDPSTPTQLGIVNGQIQQAIGTVRPWGANPIAGLMDDAKYYLWNDPQGPNGSSAGDALAKGGCRPEYIILLTHAAPNEEVQPYCQSAGGKCPYDYAENIARGLSQGAYDPTAGLVANTQSAASSGPKVLTFVIGFSMADFKKPDNSAASCKDVIQSDGTVNSTLCADPTMQATYGSCCTLEKIAVAGGTTQAYFADSKGDLDYALGSIFGLITRNVTTRTTPVTSVSSGVIGSAGGSQSALFQAQFTPSPAVPWSGNVTRQRSVCSFAGSSLSTPTQPIDATKGDDFAHNLDANQSSTRHVIVVEPYAGGAITRNAKRTIRPYMKGTGSPNASGAGFDNLTLYDGQEYTFDYQATQGSPAVDTSKITTDALGISGCPITIPGSTAPGTAFDATSCETIAFNFALGLRTGPSTWPTSVQAFPGRFYSASDRIPKSSFGDVFHSTPVVVPPPGALLRDDTYQQFVQNYTTLYHASTDQKPRHTVLYVATDDGLLHAFGTELDTYNSGSINNELWSFIPPAVMPNLISSFPSSHNLLLDGSPVVKDTVYQRTTPSSAADWHTTLVAGFGAGGAGYYALDVTDPEINPTNRTSRYDPVHATTNTNTPTPYGGTTGPHFLWQITDPTLFGVVSATPAITTIFADPGDANGGGVREIGVAILPGGGPGSAYSNAAGCGRAPNNLPTQTAAKKTAATPIGSYAAGAAVRQWASSGCAAAVPGRSVSVVRLDTGEVIRTFTRADTSIEPTGALDVTTTYALMTANSGNTGTNAAGYKYTGRVIDTQLDSPMTGTPTVYPADVGAIAQKFFIGDADGTVWRFDISSKDPNQWYGEMYLDTYNVTGQNSAGFASDTGWNVKAREPLSGPPLVSLDRNGNLAVNLGTGDQNQIGFQNAYPNFVWSTSETAQLDSATSTTKLRAQVNWFKPLLTGEMVTGPMAVFNGIWLFASYVPAAVSSSCQAGIGRFWEMDFVLPDGTASVPSTGGLARLPSTGSPGSFVQSVDLATTVIPGVAVTSSLTCATADTVSDPYVGGTSLSTSNVTPSKMTATLITGGAGKSLVDVSQPLASPRQTTIVDSWAAIVE